MNALNCLAAAVTLAAAPAFAQFSFDAATGACVDLDGKPGLNVGVRGPCADLRGQNLERADLNRLDLRGARLDGVKLMGASLQGADLRGASLANADLTRAVLTGAKLMGASLVNARLVAAHLEHAQLNDASLAGADVRNACLYRASFARADLRTAVFSSNRSLVQGALFAKALVGTGTLPFDATELAALDVEVEVVELTGL